MQPNPDSSLLQPVPMFAADPASVDVAPIVAHRRPDPGIDDDDDDDEAERPIGDPDEDEGGDDDEDDDDEEPLQV